MIFLVVNVIFGEATSQNSFKIVFITANKNIFPFHIYQDSKLTSTFTKTEIEFKKKIKNCRDLA